MKKNENNDMFVTCLRMACLYFLELSFWRMMWYMLLFWLTEGWIIPILTLYWSIKMERKRRKQVKNSEKSDKIL